MDELYGVFLKETSEVPKFFTIHPRETILSKSEPAVSSMVQPTKQVTCMINRFINTDNGNPLTIEFI